MTSELLLSGYHLLGPVEAARTLSDLAEIINHLWGVPTPGGRLYPAPIRREVVVIAWNTAGTRLSTALATALADAEDPDDQPWQYVILRAVFQPGEHYIDPDLQYFDARVDVTRYPADLLWGPGSLAGAAAWLAEHQPAPDECDYLDRTFAVRLDAGELYLPMRPSVAAALAGDERTGTWYVIRADHPNDAFNHVRNLVAGAACTRIGPCHQCHAETLGVGPYEDIRALFPHRADPTPLPLSEARTPWAHPRSRRITT